MNKQITLSAISDELAQAKTSKKEFLERIEKLIPWTKWIGITSDNSKLSSVDIFIQKTNIQMTTFSVDVGFSKFEYSLNMSFDVHPISIKLLCVLKINFNLT